jgi:hypothetical protein
MRGSASKYLLPTMFSIPIVMLLHMVAGVVLGWEIYIGSCDASQIFL